MAARLVRLDCSRGGTLIVCACGYRAIVTGTDAARAADDHRRTVHPLQARRAAAKRRQRAR